MLIVLNITNEVMDKHTRGATNLVYTLGYRPTKAT